MRDVTTAAGMLIVLGTLARYVGSVLLRAAAFTWLVFAGVGLLLAGRGDQSPCTPTAFAALGVGCWAAGHVLHRARRGWWATPMAARVFAGRPPPRYRDAPAPPSGASHRHARPRLTLVAGPRLAQRAAPRDELPVFARPRALLPDY